MRISRENYEIFFIDYLDGSLNDQQITQLEDFLLLNTDLREELEGMEKIKLQPSSVSFPDKNTLWKTDTVNPVSNENFDDYCIAYIEGDLDEEKKNTFEKFLNTRPEYKRDFNIYKKAVLIPELSTVYNLKDELKKPAPTVKRIYLYSVLSAAAAITLLMLIFWNTEFIEDIPAPLASKTESMDPVEKEKEQIISDIFSDDRTNYISETDPAKSETAEIHSKPTDNEGTKVDIESKDLLAAETEVVEKPEIKIKRLTQFNLLSPELEEPRPFIIDRNKFQDEIAGNLMPASEPDYLSLPDIALKYVNNKVLQREEPMIDPSRLTLWEVADAGIKGINRVTGSDIRFERQESSDGKTASVSFDAGFFGFTRPVR